MFYLNVISVYNPILLKAFDNLKVTLIFFFCAIPFSSYAGQQDERKETSREITSYSFFQLKSSEEPPKSHSEFGATGAIRFAVGHHDNLTKAKSFGGTKLKTSNTYLNIYLEGGVSYKIASAGVSGTYIAPIPRTKTIRSYKHEGELDDKWVWLRLRLLPPRSRFDLNTLTGYRWVNDFARISDPTGTNPDSLYLNYNDRGPLFGGEFQYRLHKLSHEGELRLILGYIHENLRENILNRYKFELGFFDQGLHRNLKGKEHLDYLVFISLGIELVKWSDGRNDWFIVGSFGGLFEK